MDAFNTNNWINEHSTITDRYGKLVSSRTPAIAFTSGFSVSIQGGGGMYSSPREDNIFKEPKFFSTVELGYPTKVIDELLEFAENPAEPTDTVYGYVPVALLDRILSTHGSYYRSDTPGFKLINRVYKVHRTRMRLLKKINK